MSAGKGRSVRTRASRRPSGASANPRERRRAAPPRSSSAAASPSNFPIIGIGASAGGLEAMTRLLRALPTEDAMAVVLVQHLDPRHESHLVEILARETSLPVRQVRDGMRVQPRNVYVIPPNTTMRLEDGSFRLARRRQVAGRVPLPVDEFLHSLAETRGPFAAGVILSGNASDGMMGMRAIKAEGGITFAQDESAQFPGMPRSSISSGAVDFVMPPEDIARELGRLARHTLLHPPAVRETKPDGETLQRIFGLVRAATGIDFRYYRQSTILRRLARRMAVNRSVTHAEYVSLLRQSPAEVAALVDDFLISVTAFFRDPDTFDLLSTVVVPRLLKERSKNQNVRVWVPGCATGEEAYSLAICLIEAQDASRPVDVQIFATDASDKAIERARQGVYDEGALQNVSPGRLRRFFNRIDGRYRVSQAVRDTCVFARQNVAADPPFSHLDILSCRNLLIYLDPGLQRRLFPLFHHVLKPTGYLVLGPAESAAPFSDLFAPIDKRHRIFTKRASASRGLPILSRHFGDPTRIAGLARAEPEAEVAGPDLAREIDRLLIGGYAPPAVVVDSNLQIVHFRGKTGTFLEPPSGATNLSVLAMAREGLLPDLRAALHKARTANQRVRKEGIRLRGDGAARRVQIEVVPLRSESPAGRLYLVLFESADEPRAGSRAGKPPAVPRNERGRLEVARKDVQRLAKELLSTKEYLQAVIEQQESTNEELKSANEEILSSNEELQSTNEELDTAKEELQSANEELTTLNEELQNRNAQLSRLNDDLINLLHSVEIPIVMLGPDGTVRRFTPAAERLLNLIPADVGRPIESIRPNIDIRDLPAKIVETVDKIVPKQFEVQDRDGRWHLLTIRPYRTLENKIDGTILSFANIDLQKKAALLAQNARDYADAIIQTVPNPMLVLDEELRVKRANAAFHRLFQTGPEETVGRSLLDIGGGDWDVPALRKRLAEGSAEVVEVEKVFDRIGRRVMLLRARWARFGIETAGDVILTFEDVTAGRLAERALKSSEVQYRTLFESSSKGALVLDAGSGAIRDVNHYLTRFLGVPRERLLGRKPWELESVSGAEDLKESIAGGEGGHPLGDIALQGKGGQTLLMEAVRNMAAAEGEGEQLTLVDVTERRRLEQELRHVQKMESIGRLAGGMAHDFNNILNIISAYAESLRRGGDPAKIAENAAAISKSVARGAGVVRQLLTFARKDEAAFRSVSVNDIVREAALMIEETFPKTVRLTSDLAAELPEVMADPDQLHQALLNLLVNARDAMPGGGELRLTTRQADQKTVREGHAEATALSYVCVEVEDSGGGMDAETQARIFEPFFTTKERGAGSGMGLAVVYGVVTSHRGFVDVESEPGKGARFRLYFPMLSPRADHAQRRARRDARPPGGSETILFVEDETELLESLAELLHQEGYTVLTARTGIEAVEVYRERRSQIALIVTDLELPEMSGWEAFGKIRELEPDARVVLVSGYLDPPMRASMIEGGATGFLRKPYTLDEMLRVMREALDEKAAERRVSGEGRRKPGGANPLEKEDADSGGGVEAHSPSPRKRKPARRSSRTRGPKRSAQRAKT